MSMRRMPFERPTKHYDERIKHIDERLCELIKERKDLSDNNPGFPQLEYISEWAQKYGLYDDLLKSIFSSLLNEKYYKPIEEPDLFRLNLPVLKFTENNNRLYSVTFIRQYNNCSIVYLNIDWENNIEADGSGRSHDCFDMYIGEQFDCRMMGGTGSDCHQSYKYIVFPPLPDELSGIDLKFRDSRKNIDIVLHL